jgi:hypothetical protein
MVLVVAYVTKRNKADVLWKILLLQVPLICATLENSENL